MNANQYRKMICTLREHVITDEGDFLPAGTPVQVVGWGDGDKDDPAAHDGGKVLVRSMAYMWADQFSVGEIEGARDGGCVGTGLWLAVHPGNLMFSEMQTQTKVGVPHSRA